MVLLLLREGPHSSDTALTHFVIVDLFVASFPVRTGRMLRLEQRRAEVLARIVHRRDAELAEKFMLQCLLGRYSLSRVILQ